MKTYCYTFTSRALILDMKYRNHTFNCFMSKENSKLKRVFELTKKGIIISGNSCTSIDSLNMD